MSNSAVKRKFRARLSHRRQTRPYEGHELRPAWRTGLTHSSQRRAGWSHPRRGVGNLGYLQLKATPGVYHLEICDGRGREVFDLARKRGQ